MTTVVRTTGSTIVALLGTINSTAGAIAKVVDTATSSVDMLDTFVQRAKSHQADAHAIEDRHWRRNLILDNAKTQEKIETDLIGEYSNNIVRQNKFNEIVADLELLFTEKQS